MNLIIKDTNGSIKEVEVTANMNIEVQPGQQFFFTGATSSDFSVSGDNKDLRLSLVDENGETINIGMAGLAEHISENDPSDPFSLTTALGVSTTREGDAEIQEIVNNPELEVGEMIDNLKEALAQSNTGADKDGVVIDDFGSLADLSKASEAGAELETSEPIIVEESRQQDVTPAKARASRDSNESPEREEEDQEEEPEEEDDIIVEDTASEPVVVDEHSISENTIAEDTRDAIPENTIDEQVITEAKAEDTTAEDTKGDTAEDTTPEDTTEAKAEDTIAEVVNVESSPEETTAEDTNDAIAEDTTDNVVNSPAKPEETVAEDTIDAIAEDTTSEDTVDAIDEDTTAENTTDAVVEDTVDETQSFTNSENDDTSVIPEMDLGDGIDKLNIDFDDAIDISNIAQNIDNVEIIDTTNGVDQTVTIDLESVVDMTDSDNELVFIGDDGDVIDFSKSEEWTKSEGTKTVDGVDGDFNEYVSTTNPDVTVFVNEEVEVIPSDL